MPPAVAAIAAPVAGAVGSSVGGKKGGGASSRLAQQTADRQFQMQQQLMNAGLGAFNPAADYFKSLLSGDPTKVAQAVGPTSDVLKGQAASQSRQLAATMPAGGEANAAQATNAQNSSNNLARLYAGVQPGAATALGQLAGTPIGAGAPNIGSGLKYDTHQQEQRSQSKGALGSGLGSLAAGGVQRAKQGKSGGNRNPNSPSGIGASGDSTGWFD